MSPTTYNFNGGSSGSAATPASTGASAVSGAVTHQSAMAQEGSAGLQFASTSSTVAVIDFKSFTNDRREEVRFCFRMLDTAPTQDTVILQIYGGSTGTATIARLRHETTNKISLADTATSHVTTVVADASAYLGQWVAISLLIDTGTTASDGTAKVRFHTNPFDPVDTYLGTEASATAQNFGSATGTTYVITQFRLGIATVSTSARTAGADYLQIDSGATSFSLGAPPTASPPTANAGPDQYPLAGDVVTYTGAASVAGSGSLTYAWTVLEYPPGTSNPSLSAPSAVSGTFTVAAGVTVLQLVVTQTGGLTATDTVIFWCHPASNADVKVYGLSAATAWTNEGGAASITAALNDTSQATWAQSPNDPAPTQLLPLIMCPFGPGPISIDFEGDYESVVVTRAVSITKEDGTTVVTTDSWSLQDNIVIHTVTVDVTSISSLSDRRALRVNIGDD